MLYWLNLILNKEFIKINFFLIFNNKLKIIKHLIIRKNKII